MANEFHLPLHPLAAGLTTSVVEGKSLKDAINAAKAALAQPEAGAAPPAGPPQAPPADPPQAPPADPPQASAPPAPQGGDAHVDRAAGQLGLRQDRLFRHRAARLGTEARSHDVVTFAGYLGAYVDDKSPSADDETDEKARRWQVLYLDVNVATWLIIPLEDIVLHNRIDDDKAAFGQRDMIWVKSDARIGRGDSTSTVQGQFLSGGFTRAGDFEVSLRSSTFSRSSGVMCEAITPDCCKKLSP